MCYTHTYKHCLQIYEYIWDNFIPNLFFDFLRSNLILVKLIHPQAHLYSNTYKHTRLRSANSEKKKNRHQLRLSDPCLWSLYLADRSRRIKSSRSESVTNKILAWKQHKICNSHRVSTTMTWTGWPWCPLFQEPERCVSLFQVLFKSSLISPSAASLPPPEHGWIIILVLVKSPCFTDLFQSKNEMK